MTGEEASAKLQQHFAKLGLSAQAATFLVLLWQATQVMDDVVDRQLVERPAAVLASWNLLIGIHEDPFWLKHKASLLPVMASAFMRWVAATEAEDDKAHDARSYMWRAGFYDVALAALAADRGSAYAISRARAMLSLYGETLQDYLKEFDHA